MTFLILLCFERYLKGAYRTAGAILAVAAGMSVLCGALLLGVSLALGGIDLHLKFISQMRTAGELLPISTINYGIEAVVGAITYGVTHGITLSSDTQFPMAIPGNIWGRLLGWAVVTVVMAFLVRRTADLPRSEALYRRLIGLWCLTVVAAPLAWSHYVLGPLFLLPGCWKSGRGRTGKSLVIFAAVAVSVLLLSVLPARAAAPYLQPLLIIGLLLVIPIALSLKPARVAQGSNPEANSPPRTWLPTADRLGAPQLQPSLALKVVDATHPATGQTTTAASHAPR